MTSEISVSDISRTRYPSNILQLMAPILEKPRYSRYEAAIWSYYRRYRVSWHSARSYQLSRPRGSACTRPPWPSGYRVLGYGSGRWSLPRLIAATSINISYGWKLSSPIRARHARVALFILASPIYLFYASPISFSLSLFLANSLLFGCKIYHDALYKEGYLIVSILYIYIITLERIFANKDDGIWLELARCKVNGIKIRVYLTIHDTSTRDIEVLHPGFGISTELSFWEFQPLDQIQLLSLSAPIPLHAPPIKDAHRR